ncbi:MAG: hypothetical protein AAGC55_08850 [Myxococcota bacterium]
MANLLVCAVPEAVRKAAYTSLVKTILPLKLAGLEEHPRPQRLCTVVYRDLAKVMMEKPAMLRLHVLKLQALDAEILHLGKESLNLALGRFCASTRATSTPNSWSAG